jgi:hypothetical protein
MTKPFYVAAFSIVRARGLHQLLGPELGSRSANSGRIDPLLRRGLDDG